MIDDFEDQRIALREVIPSWHFDRDARLSQRALRPHDALCTLSTFGERKARAISSVVRLAEQSKRESHPRFHGKHGVTRGEDQAEEITNLIVERCIETWKPPHPAPLPVRRQSRRAYDRASCCAGKRRWPAVSPWPSARRPDCPERLTFRKPRLQRTRPARPAPDPPSSPTSRTILARPAMSLADSIRQTASMVRCVLASVMA